VSGVPADERDEVVGVALAQQLIKTLALLVGSQPLAMQQGELLRWQHLERLAGYPRPAHSASV
jgi:hypothetical protein